jgi:predicted outer membrane repeat protein
MTRIRLFVVLLLVLAALGLHATPTPALAAGFCPSSEQDIITAISNVGAGGTVTLSCSSATTIYFDTANGHNGTGGPVTISQSVTLDASGSPEPIALDGGHTVQLFQIVNAGKTLGLSHLTLQNGYATNGGAVANEFGTVTITDSTLSGNTASTYGGAIFNSGTTASVTVTDSTLSGNSASYYGGAIFDYGDSVTITGSTLAGNSAVHGGGAIYTEGGTTSVGASIIAGSTSGGNCSSIGGTVTDLGYNLTDSNGACGLTGGTDLTNTDPQLGPLTDNGGPTQTKALASTSPARDAIPTSTGLCSATDQRGMTRPDEGETSCDIGALESLYTNTGPPQQVANCSFFSLQNDLQYGGSYYYTPGQCPNPIPFTGTITIGQNASLTAQGNDVTLDGGGSVRLFSVSGGVSFGLTGLTLSGGSVQNQDTGGAIHNAGTLTITKSTLSGNYSWGSDELPEGGAIANTGTLTITGSTLSGNYSHSIGGAIGNSGTLTITNSTIANNSSRDQGGAIENNAGTLTITSSTIANNSAPALA